MKKSHESLIVASLAGLIIVSVAALAVQPALAEGYGVESPALVSGVKSWDVLNVRKWPASYSQQVGAFEPQTSVWVERCIVAPQGGADWCLVEQQDTKGWVNASYLSMLYDADL